MKNRRILEHTAFFFAEANPIFAVLCCVFLPVVSTAANCNITLFKVGASLKLFGVNSCLLSFVMYVNEWREEELLWLLISTAYITIFKCEFICTTDFLNRKIIEPV
eukprot:m.214116 g.214116  ORF g.214116 m.214116 type:complete len:106 (+) comp39805_c0_seq7:1161-1478(+)